MNKKALEAFGKQAAKSIKTEADLTDFRRMLTKITVEAALNAELDEHLGYARHEQSQQNNYRNGYSSKTIRTEDGQVDLDAPRDRDSSFDTVLSAADAPLSSYLPVADDDGAQRLPSPP